MEPRMSPPKTRLRKRRKKAARKPKRKRPQVVAPDLELHHCDICGKDIKHRSNFREHQRIHTGERPYRCQHCEKTFARCADLIKHRLVHSARRPFRCRICGKRFKLRADLEKHAKAHSDGSPLPLPLVRQALQAHLLPGETPADPHAGKALRLLPLRPALQVGSLGQRTRVGSHGRASPLLRPVPPKPSGIVPPSCSTSAPIKSAPPSAASTAPSLSITSPIS